MSSNHVISLRHFAFCYCDSVGILQDSIILHFAEYAKTLLSSFVDSVITCV